MVQIHNDQIKHKFIYSEWEFTGTHWLYINSVFKKIFRNLTTSETNIGADQKVGRIGVWNCCF